MANNAQDVLTIARGQIGYSRWNDPKAGTVYGRWYADKMRSSYFGTNGVPYCAMFVSWVFEHAGATCAGLPAAYCPYIARDAKTQGRTVQVSQAQAGDVVLFDWGKDGVADHAGIVEQNNGTYLTTIEGNTSVGSQGSQGNGGVVARRTRAYSSVHCVIRPNYASQGRTVPAGVRTQTPQISVDGWAGKATITRAQQIAGTYVDGVISGQVRSNKQYVPRLASVTYGTSGSNLVRAIQRACGAVADGHMGKNTVRAMQAKLGVTQDGYMGAATVSAWQRALNAGRLV